MEISPSPEIIVLLAAILDLIFGDPAYHFHPVRVMGRSIIFCEKVFFDITSNRVFNGLMFLVSLITLWFGGVLILYLSLGSENLIIYSFSTYMIYSLLSIKDLAVKAGEVRDALLSKDLGKARKNVGMIVGRDTVNLDEKDIIRATVETVAESMVDGIISPLVYLLLGGVPGMIFYKLVNTLDSMVGYRNEKYDEFGRCSARLDDILNFIPSRLSPLIISTAALFMGKGFFKGIKMSIRDGGRNPSPNSGISEATVAGLLGVQLGGDNFYGGKLSAKPLLGNKDREFVEDDIRVASLIAVGVGVLTVLVVIAFLKIHGGFFLEY